MPRTDHLLKLSRHSSEKLLKLFFSLLIILFILCLGLFSILNTSALKSQIQRIVQSKLRTKVEYSKLQIQGFDRLIISDPSLGEPYHFDANLVILDLNLSQSLRSFSPTLDSISIHDPKVDVNLDKMKELLTAPPPSVITQTKKQKPRPATTVNPVHKKQTPTQPAPPNQPAPTAPPIAAKKEKPQPPPPTLYPKIHIRNAQLSFTSKGLPVASLSHIDFTSHTHRDELSGTLKVQALQVKGFHSKLPFSFPVTLKNNTVSIPQHSQQVSHFTANIYARAHLRAHLPFSFSASLSQSAPANIPLSKDQMLALKLHSSQAEWKASGFLKRPLSMRSDLVAELRNIAPSHKTKGTHHFHHARIQAHLRNGQILIPQYHIYSPEVSYLGNALVQREKGYAVVRMVADNTWKNYAVRVKRGALFPFENFFPELDTPDRFYQDFYFKRDLISGPNLYRLSQDDQWSSLDTLINKSRWFFKRELWTEEQQ